MARSSRLKSFPSPQTQWPSAHLTGTAIDSTLSLGELADGPCHTYICGAAIDAPCTGWLCTGTGTGFLVAAMGTFLVNENELL
jgi:hypothetical protein